MRISRAALIAVLALPVVVIGQEDVDLSVVHRIKIEAFDHSQVMDHLFYLTSVYGPRLTNSPNYDRAAKWAVERLKTYGVENASTESWGRFGRGWSFSRVSVRLKQPADVAFTAVPLAWTDGTQGPVTGEAILAPPFEEERETDIAKVDELVNAYMQKYKGQLKGRVVLLHKLRNLQLPTTALAQRRDDKDLATVAEAPAPVKHVEVKLPITSFPKDPEERAAFFASVPMAPLMDYFDRFDRVMLKLYTFLRQEGALAALTTDDRGSGGIVFAESAGVPDPTAPVPGPVIVLIPEHYNRLVRLVQHKIPVQVEVDLATRFNDADLDGHNIIAEIPGGAKRDEVVMLGGHFDSWHGGTGATDNGTGSAVAIEAFRILKALNLKMDRTVRLALWGGEEQGLLGSRGYVKQHFGDPDTMSLKPEQQKISAYFNLDNGSGKIRGVYLQGNDMVRPIFARWLEPFRDEGAATLSIRNTGGTDHLSFDAVGIPGFQFIQDPLDYGTRTHHSNMDLYDRAQAPDLMEASAIMATFVYEAATRRELLPRKPSAKPMPTTSGTGR